MTTSSNHYNDDTNKLEALKREREESLIRQVTDANDHFGNKNMFYLLRPEEHDRDVIYPEMPDTLEKFLERFQDYETHSYDYRIKLSWWQLFLDRGYKFYELNERVGFDACKLRMEPKMVDEYRFTEAVEKYGTHNKHRESDYPYVTVYPAAKGQEKLSFPIDVPYYRITITIDPYLYIDYRLDGDIQSELLHVHVRPPMGHGVLGNIANYSYRQMNNQVQKATTVLWETFGIYVEYNTIRFQTMEINMTFEMNCTYDELCRALSYHSPYMRDEDGKNKGKEFYKTGRFSHGGYKPIYTKDNIEKMHPADIMEGISTHCGTVAAKLYDKGAEISNTLESDELPILLEHKRGEAPCLYRLEFKLTKYETISRYFNGDNHIAGLSQEILEQVFRKLVDKFYGYTWRKYCRDRKSLLLDVFAQLDTSRNKKSAKGNWQLQLLNGLYRYVLEFQTSAPLVWSIVDLEETMRKNELFAKHPSKYLPKICEVLKGSEMFPDRTDRLYQILGNFFLKATQSGGLSAHRRVGYVSMESMDRIRNFVRDFADNYEQYNNGESEQSTEEVLRLVSDYMCCEDAAKIQLKYLADMGLDDFDDESCGDSVLRFDDPYLKEIVAPLKTLQMSDLEILSCFNWANFRISSDSENICYLPLEDD